MFLGRKFQHKEWFEEVTNYFSTRVPRYQLPFLNAVAMPFLKNNYFHLLIAV